MSWSLCPAILLPNIVNKGTYMAKYTVTRDNYVAKA
jgi:hypothetical protein